MSRSPPPSKSSPTTMAPPRRPTRWPATTGCDQLSFNPSLYAQPTTAQTDSASGLEVDLRFPSDEPDVPSPSEIAATR